MLPVQSMATLCQDEIIGGARRAMEDNSTNCFVKLICDRIWSLAVISIEIKETIKPGLNDL